MANTIKFSNDKKPGVDDYFKSMFGANTNDIQHIELYKLIPFEGQPFKPYSDEKLQELAEDISENGILSPLIVRPYENTYQILAGHNRANAAMLAGLDTVPCIVKSVDDDTAVSIMLTTNLNQREKLLPSEKAYAYKMKLDSMNSQGKRNDLTCSQLGNKFVGKKSSEVLADQVGESKNQIFRYIRLTELIPELLDTVDNETISFGAGVSLSYLNEDNQKRLLTFMADLKIESVTLDQAEQIKNLDDLTSECLNEIFGIKVRHSADPKPEKAKTVNLKIPVEFFGKKPPKICADEELYRRVADTIRQYCKEIE